jgi:hypothetical protein
METQNSFKEILRYCCLKSFLVISFLFMFLCKAECQESEMSESVFKGGSYEKTFSTVRTGLAQSVLTVPKGEFHIVVLHRFTEISSSVNKFFGLDYASTRLGLDYGILNWLSAGFGRSMTVQTYDFELKAVMLKQNESNIPVSLSWYVSALENTSQSSEWNGHNSFSSRMSIINQFFIARNQGILSFQVSPLWVHSMYDLKTGGSMDVYAIDLDSRIRLSEKLGLIAEYIPILSSEPFPTINPFTLALDINTGGHQFQLIFSNSQGTNEKEILTNTTGSWFRHLYFGFNLTRIFHSKMD